MKANRIEITKDRTWIKHRKILARIKKKFPSEKLKQFKRPLNSKETQIECVVGTR